MKSHANLTGPCLSKEFGRPADTLISMGNLAGGFRDAGKLEQALPLLKETLKLTRAKLGPDHPDTLRSMNNLAMGYGAAGQLDRALPLYEQAALGVEKRRFQHEHAGQIVPNFISALEEAKELAKAETWRRKRLAHVKSTAGAESPTYSGELAALGLNLLQQKKWTDAGSALRECLTIREKKEPEAWTTFNTLSMLGGSLRGQKKYAEAEPLLVKGYEGMKARLEQKPVADADRLAMQQRLIEALDRLIELYTATNKPDEVKKYQELRAKYPPAAPMPREEKK